MSDLTAYVLARRTRGWRVLKGEVTTIKRIVGDLPPNPVIINIGAGTIGLFTLAMIEERPDAVVFSCDVNPAEGEFETLRKAGQDCTRVKRVLGTSYAIGKHWPFPVDMVFVDGDHTYEAVCGDIEVWLPKIKLGGFIIFHDHAPPRPRNETPAQLQKEAWVARAVVDMMGDEYEVIAHEDRIKAFRIPGNKNAL